MRKDADGEMYVSNVTINVMPHQNGRSFSVKLFHDEEVEPFIEREGLQADMVQERLEDIINPAIRLMAKELDLELKKRRSQK